MRKFLSLIIISLSFSSIFLLTACSKEDDDSLGKQNPNELLHLKMKVNDKEWISENTEGTIATEATYTVWKAEENLKDRPYEIDIEGRSTNNFPDGLNEFGIHIILKEPVKLGSYTNENVHYAKFRLADANGGILKGYENYGEFRVTINSMTQIKETEYSIVYRIRGTFHGKVKNIEPGKDDTFTITDGEYK